MFNHHIHVCIAIHVYIAMYVLEMGDIDILVSGYCKAKISQFIAIIDLTVL